jgi:hypothetical protein
MSDGSGPSGILGVIVGAILVIVVGAGVLMYSGKLSGGGGGGGGGANVTLKVPGTTK